MENGKYHAYSGSNNERWDVGRVRLQILYVTLWFYFIYFLRILLQIFLSFYLALFLSNPILSFFLFNIFTRYCYLSNYSFSTLEHHEIFHFVWYVSLGFHRRLNFVKGLLTSNIESVANTRSG